ncbi:hypothetical protein C8Q78DRAFT_982805 [Trametes maxima]|nr:hypothetical protein C8Q78DRAFT_982805 [Trametes maxima]
MNDRHYARDDIENPLDILHQRRTWPLPCALCRSDLPSLPQLFFAVTVDSEDHSICSIVRDPPDPHPLDDDLEIDALPVVFTIIGQIAPEDCYLTAEGDTRDMRPDHVQDRPLVSFWMESRPDRDSCLEWRQYPSAIERVACVAEDPEVNTSRVIRFKPNERAVQLRLRFSPYEGQIKDTLPFIYNRSNTRRVPETLQDVPFDTPFRATFTLECIREGDETFLFADLLTLTDI